MRVALVAYVPDQLCPWAVIGTTEWIDDRQFNHPQTAAQMARPSRTRQRKSFYMPGVSWGQFHQLLAVREIIQNRPRGGLHGSKRGVSGSIGHLASPPGSAFAGITKRARPSGKVSPPVPYRGQGHHKQHRQVTGHAHGRGEPSARYKSRLGPASGGIPCDGAFGHRWRPSPFNVKNVTAIWKRQPELRAIAAKGGGIKSQRHHRPCCRHPFDQAHPVLAGLKRC